MPLTIKGIIENTDSFYLNNCYTCGTLNIEDFEHFTFAYSDFVNFLFGIEKTCLESSSMSIINFATSTWDLRVVRPFIDIQTTKFAFDVNGVQRRPDKKLANYVPDYFPTYDDVDRQEYMPELAPGKEDEC